MSERNRKPHNVPRYNDKRNCELYDGTAVVVSSSFQKHKTLHDDQTELDTQRRTGSEFDKAQDGVDDQRTGVEFDVDRGLNMFGGSNKLNGLLFFSRILNFTMWGAGISFAVVLVLIGLTLYLPSDKGTIINPWSDKFFDVTKILIGTIVGLLGGKFATKE